MLACSSVVFFWGCSASLWPGQPHASSINGEWKDFLCLGFCCIFNLAVFLWRYSRWICLLEEAWLWCIQIAITRAVLGLGEILEVFFGLGCFGLELKDGVARETWFGNNFKGFRSWALAAAAVANERKYAAAVWIWGFLWRRVARFWLKRCSGRTLCRWSSNDRCVARLIGAEAHGEFVWMIKLSPGQMLIILACFCAWSCADSSSLERVLFCRFHAEEIEQKVLIHGFNFGSNLSQNRILRPIRWLSSG